MSRFPHQRYRFSPLESALNGRKPQKLVQLCVDAALYAILKNHLFLVLPFSVLVSRLCQSAHQLVAVLGHFLLRMFNNCTYLVQGMGDLLVNGFLSG